MKYKIAFILIVPIATLLGSYLLGELLNKPIAHIGYIKTGENTIVIYAYAYDEHGKNRGIKEVILFEDSQIIKSQKFFVSGLEYTDFSIEQPYDKSFSHIYYAKVIDISGNEAKSNEILISNNR